MLERVKMEMYRNNIAAPSPELHGSTAHEIQIQKKCTDEIG
jgi:hypothetical protein